MARRTIIQRRRTGHWLLMAAILVAICIVLVGRSAAGPFGTALWDRAAAGVVLAILAIMLVREIRAGRRLAVLVESDWSRCLYCFFDLRGLTHNGDCPECGQPYKLERTRRVWRQAMSPESKGRAERIAEAD